MVSRRSLLTAAGAATAAAALGPLSPLVPTAAAAGVSLPVRLANSSGQGTVYAYISGTDSSGWPVFVSANGALNRLPSPSSPVTPIADYSISLGASGSAATTVNLTNYVIGGRVWFSVGKKLQFFVNPGSPPGVVQPALVSSDPNWATNWTFCEFTFNSANLYANISYVDMVALPISMASTGGGGNQSVSPLPSGALALIASGLQAQHASDRAPWDRLVATDSSGGVLRVMAPAHSPVDFGGYWDDYLNRVWSRYASTPLSINGQGGIGSYAGRVSGNAIVFSGLNTNGVPFTKPSAVDIFGCASGPLYNSGGDARGAIAARLAAALNRSTLLVPGGNNNPDGVTPSQYYTDPVTNHYARLVHKYAGIGYAFPYDDVGPTGSAPVDGHIQDGAPTSWSITLGAGGGSGGGYRLIRNKNSGKVMGVDLMSTANSAHVVQFEDNGTADHLWQLIDKGDGWYRIRNKNSGKVLGVDLMSTANSAHVVQFEDNGTADHLWQLIDNGDGWYRIRNKNSGKVLGVDLMSTANSAHVVQFEENGTADHLWQFV